MFDCLSFVCFFLLDFHWCVFFISSKQTDIKALEKFEYVWMRRKSANVDYYCYYCFSVSIILSKNCDVMVDSLLLSLTHRNHRLIHLYSYQINNVVHVPLNKMGNNVIFLICRLSTKNNVMCNTWVDFPHRFWRTPELQIKWEETVKEFLQATRESIKTT